MFPGNSQWLFELKTGEVFFATVETKFDGGLQLKNFCPFLVNNTNDDSMSIKSHPLIYQLKEFKSMVRLSGENNGRYSLNMTHQTLKSIEKQILNYKSFWINNRDNDVRQAIVDIMSSSFIAITATYQNCKVSFLSIATTMETIVFNMRVESLEKQKLPPEFQAILESPIILKVIFDDDSKKLATIMYNQFNVKLNNILDLQSTIKRLKKVDLTEPYPLALCLHDTYNLPTSIAIKGNMEQQVDNHKLAINVTFLTQLYLSFEDSLILS